LKDADALADFYVELLGWEKVLSGNGWAGLRSHQGWILAFQEVEDYIPPVWPWKKGQTTADGPYGFLCPGPESSRFPRPELRRHQVGSPIF
jgi:hypothetical protein